FTDEMELTVGEDITNALFSIPLRFSSEENPGRVVLHLSSLSTFSEVSFGTELELISFDGAGNLLYRVTAPYVKILPMTIDSEPKLFLMMRALDRSNQAIQWEPVWTDLEQSETENTQLLLDLSYEHFLMLSKLMRGLSALSVVELFIAAQQFGAYGYISQVFQAEIIYRLAEFTSLLPIAIFVIVMGWRYRAKKQSWYLGIPMLAVLPLVFNEVVFFYQRILNTIGMWAVISFGFSAAISIFVIGTLFFFVLALITLAAQKA
ncbi:MAG: hypothetical protein LBT13_10750, partial [Treponema sp.]|nr:hypothetical protein [Treponema sp.]